LKEFGIMLRKTRRLKPKEVRKCNAPAILCLVHEVIRFPFLPFVSMCEEEEERKKTKSYITSWLKHGVTETVFPPLSHLFPRALHITSFH
jgi:hypothetical protein